jgi:hypothetical protein
MRAIMAEGPADQSCNICYCRAKPQAMADKAPAYLNKDEIR